MKVAVEQKPDSDPEKGELGRYDGVEEKAGDAGSLPARVNVTPYFRDILQSLVSY